MKKYFKTMMIMIYDDLFYKYSRNNKFLFIKFKEKMVSIQGLINEYRNNRKLLLLIVYVALFLDNMLLTTVGMFNYIYISC